MIRLKHSLLDELTKKWVENHPDADKELVNNTYLVRKVIEEYLKK